MSSQLPQDAESIALSAFQHLASDEELLLRFCELSGLTISDLREASSQPGFLVGVLDFFLAHEPDLLAWAEADSISPERIAAARSILAPDQQSDFS